MAEPSQGGSGIPIGWLVAAAAGFMLIILAVNANDDPTVATGVENKPSDNVSTAADLPPAPQPPLPLDVSAARRGYRQFQMVAAAHAPGSSEIFSRNCYEALGKPMDWHQLDRCGAYDALAARWTELNEDSAGQDDLNYFQSETTATRYLQAASLGGLPGEDADLRWAAIQRMALKAHLASSKPDPPAAAVAVNSDEEKDESNLSADGTDLNSTDSPVD